MEIWKDIEGYSRYQVSNKGRIKSKERRTPCNTGVVLRKERIVKPQLRGKSTLKYQCIRLHGDDGRIKALSIHRLVADAFIPNTENKLTVDHIDRNTMNNDVSNLRWATLSEQALNRKNSVKTVSVVATDSNGVKYYFNSIDEASKELNVDSGSISKVISDKYINKTAGGYHFEIY